MSGAPLFAKLAVFGVGALLGTTGVGAFVGVAWPVDHLIDTLFHGIDRARRARMKTLCGCLADDLARLLPVDPGTGEAAHLKAEELIRAFGLSDAELAALDLDPARAASDVLRHATFTRDEAVELRPAVERILTCFYGSLPRQPDLLAGLLPDIHGVVLARLRRIEDEQRRQGEEQRRQREAQERFAEEQRARHAELMAAIAAEKGVPLKTLGEILSRFGDDAVALDLSVIEQRLRAKAEEYRALDARLRRLSNDDPEVQRLRREAADLIAAADFAAADARLAQAEALDLAAVDDLEQLARRRRLGAAESRAERAAAARLALDYRAAAAHFAEAAGIVTATDPERRLDYLEREFSALYDQGNEFGDNAALRLAIERSRALLSLYPRDQAASDWARTQNNLGNALRTLGEREPGAARLEEAVAAYRDTLLEWTHERAPLDWARAQNNLGNAL
ncbi:MAG TPA: hypothetical protein PKA13_15270, partial [Geminicoccaceae bacterium]|nr:hypothetical protein [Geminicoccus sp.]HMU51135.1 hypothetical protein [Geminicoccaceae bacterium]